MRPKGLVLSGYSTRAEPLPAPYMKGNGKNIWSSDCLYQPEEKWNENLRRGSTGAIAPRTLTVSEVGNSRSITTMSAGRPDLLDDPLIAQHTGEQELSDPQDTEVEYSSTREAFAAYMERLAKRDELEMQKTRKSHHSSHEERLIERDSATDARCERLGSRTDFPFDLDRSGCAGSSNHPHGPQQIVYPALSSQRRFVPILPKPPQVTHPRLTNHPNVNHPSPLSQTQNAYPTLPSFRDFVEIAGLVLPFGQDTRELSEYGGSVVTLTTSYLQENFVGGSQGQGLPESLLASCGAVSEGTNDQIANDGSANEQKQGEQTFIHAAEASVGQQQIMRTGGDDPRSEFSPSTRFQSVLAEDSSHQTQAANLYMYHPNLLQRASDSTSYGSPYAAYDQSVRLSSRPVTSETQALLNTSLDPLQPELSMYTESRVRRHPDSRLQHRRSNAQSGYGVTYGQGLQSQYDLPERTSVERFPHLNLGGEAVAEWQALFPANSRRQTMRRPSFLTSQSSHLITPQRIAPRPPRARGPKSYKDSQDIITQQHNSPTQRLNNLNAKRNSWSESSDLQEEPLYNPPGWNEPTEIGLNWRGRQGYSGSSTILTQQQQPAQSAQPSSIPKESNVGPLATSTPNPSPHYTSADPQGLPSLEMARGAENLPFVEAARTVGPSKWGVAKVANVSE